MSVIEWLRRKPIYELWRLHRQSQQNRAVLSILNELCACRGSYSISETKSRLAELSNQRRKILPQTRTAVFGTCDWEQHGLWPALSRIGPMELFDYRERIPKAAGPQRGLRRKLGKEFIRHVDEMEKVSPVNLVFFYSAGYFLDPDMLHELNSRGIWTVLLGLDDKQQLPGPRRGDLEDWQLEAAQSVDLYWTTWRTGADWLATKGVRPWYAAEAADPTIFAPHNFMVRDIDVLWVGRGYGKRYQLVKWLRSRGFTVTAFGPGWEGGMVPFKQMLELYGRAKVVLGMGGVGQTDQIKHLKGRDFEVPMSGALYLTSYNPELTDHFHVGREILCYSSYVECADLIHWVYCHPEQAENIRLAAHERSIAMHTWDCRIKSMLSLFPVISDARSFQRTEEIPRGMISLND